MKRILFILIAAATLTSCATSGWSCKKRYCTNEVTNAETRNV